MTNVCIFHQTPHPKTEPFIRSIINNLNADNVCDATGSDFGNKPTWNNKPLISGCSLLFERAFKKLCIFKRNSWPIQLNKLKRKLTAAGIDVVLAEYGPSAVSILPVCASLKIPMVSHFHGFDVWMNNVKEQYIEEYKKVFNHSSKIIAVSHDMKKELVRMGAPADKTIIIPCGVDIDCFKPVNPADNKPSLVGVGAFREKKAPDKTILAFSKIAEDCPEAILTIFGDGPLHNSCKALVSELELSSKVFLPGKIDHKDVAEKISKARAFVQHSVQANNGDKEGTPVAILESCCCGIPVISTRHAGIGEVIMDQETGLLVDENDIDGMASHMKTLLENPQKAKSLGEKAAEYCRKNYSILATTTKLNEILDKSVLEN
jgi:glycosyltransferase involved in cell wall biosynthesis